MIPPGTKGPRGKAWNKPGRYVTNPAKAREVWGRKPSYGIGVVHAPSGTCALDVDHVEHTRQVFAELGIDYENLLDGGAPRWRGRPDRDKALWRVPAGVELALHVLKWPPLPDDVARHNAEEKIWEANGKAGEKPIPPKPVTVFELRAGPVQDVLPPSIHPDTGQPYEWVTEPGVDIPEIPAALLDLWQHWGEFEPALRGMCPWAVPPPPERAASAGGGGGDVIGAYNRSHTVVELLESHGYIPKGGPGRYLSPTSSSGLPGVHLLDDGRVYSHHASDPLAQPGEDGKQHAHAAFDVFRILNHGGDVRAAVKAAAAELGVPCEPGSRTASLDSVEILDAAPASLTRPLCLVGGHAYAATWLHMEHLIRTSEDKAGNTVTHDPPRKETRQNLVVVRDDGKLFTNERLPDSEPLAALKLTVHLEEIPQPSALWSGKGVKRYMKGERPAPADVFKRVVAVVDRFMDFDRSLAPQRTMAEMVACYILATYILEALNVAGYLWPRGEPGSGKTHLLRTACSLAYLGTVILAGGSFASLRDLADYGATLAFDDAEKLDAKTADPDKRALLLAGNRRGVTVPMKEPDGPKKWKTRHVNTYCHRMFSATRLPDSVLGSRSIVIPLVRSAHPDKATVDPLDPEAWPLDRRTLVDDLWALGLTHLRQLKKYDATAAARAHLKGRVLDPWRGILAVALWLQETYGEAGLFERMEALSRAYQKERSELEVSDATRLLIRALLAIFARSDASRLEVTPKELAQEVNRLARDEDLADEGESWTDHQRVGKLLSRLRLGEAGRTG
ncbi:MAG TPA: bifunctional DNA primase/polymerase, partial [bacterium]